jgi:hypothetical protein
LFPDSLDYGLKLAAEQSRSGKGHDALATVESLRKLAAPASEDPRIELEEAGAWEALGDLKHQEQPLARAVEKARAQGARLILAEARQNQCRMFSYFGQLQNAVAACRESRDIRAAAGDQKGEAKSLRTWADAITETDGSVADSTRSGGSPKDRREDDLSLRAARTHSLRADPVQRPVLEVSDLGLGPRAQLSAHESETVQTSGLS